MAAKGLSITPSEASEIIKKRFEKEKNNEIEVDCSVTINDINEFIIKCEFDKFCELFDKIFGDEELLYVKEEDYLDSEDGLCPILEEIVSRIKQKLQEVHKERILKFLFKLIKELLIKIDSDK